MVAMVYSEEINNPAPGVAKLVAACFALSAFGIAMLAGLFGGNEATTVLTRALLAVIVCYPLGLIAGMMADMVIQEQVKTEAQAEAESKPDGPVGDPVAHQTERRDEGTEG